MARSKAVKRNQRRRGIGLQTSGRGILIIERMTAILKKQKNPKNEPMEAYLRREGKAYREAAAFVDRTTVHRRKPTKRKSKKRKVRGNYSLSKR